MDNPYDGYIAVTSFEVKGYYNDEPPTIVKEGTHLLFSRKTQEDWEFVHNGRYVYITEQVVKDNVKIHSDLYQEQFAQLDKSHLYFGQLDRSDSFIVKENGLDIIYYKIGQYTTQDGVKYNAVREQPYWEADNVEKFNISDMRYFQEDYLIEKNYNFRISADEQHLDGTYNFMKAKAFKFIEPIQVCDYMIYHPRMLEVIEYLFQGKQLNQELKNVYTEYKSDMNHEENRMGGFFETDDIALPDLLERIKEEKQIPTKASRYW